MTRAAFLAIMAVRRGFTPGSADHEYLSRSACKMVWLLNGIPVDQWRE